MEWIKTSDRLPELYGGISKRVLLWNQKYEFAEFGYLDEVKEGYVWMGKIGLSPLDHYPYWMPITSPEEE